MVSEAHLVDSGLVSASTAQSAAVGDHNRLELAAAALPCRNDATLFCSLGRDTQSGPCHTNNPVFLMCIPLLAYPTYNIYPIYNTNTIYIIYPKVYNIL